MNIHIHIFIYIVLLSFVELLEDNGLARCLAICRLELLLLQRALRPTTGSNFFSFLVNDLLQEVFNVHGERVSA